MSQSQKVRGLVVSRRNIGEADRLVTLLTQEHGTLKVIAKGVRKIPSHRGGHLEPFTQVLALVRSSKAPSAAGHTNSFLGAVETEHYFPELKTDPKAFTHAQSMVQAALALIGEGEPVPDLFTTMQYAWRVLPTLPPAKQDMLEGAMLLLTLRYAGMLPSWQQCASCGVSVPTESVVLDALAGGWRCITCQNSLRDAQFSLPPKLVAVLRYVSLKPETTLKIAVAPEQSSQLLSSLRYFMHGMVTTMSSR